MSRRTAWSCAGIAVWALGCGSAASDPDDASSTGALDSSGGASESASASASGADGASTTNASTTGATNPSTTAADSGDTTTGDADDTGPMPTLGACDSLAAKGTFEDITPPEVAAGFGVVQDGGGTFAFAVDPINQGTLYLGTLRQKVWKSTDCGASWVHISTGENGEAVDSGMNWTFAVDPFEPEVVYTNAGYGAYGNGLFKSSNGGVDWAVVWPPAAQPELAASFTYNFANVIAIDPDDHQHVLLTFHESCLPPHTATCIAESHDAGASWALHDGDPSWNGNEGQVIFFLDDADTWLWGSQTNGFWRSPDGTAPTWSLVPDTGPIVGGIVDDGTSLYASTCYFGDFCEQARYLTSSDDGQTWTQMDAPPLGMGGSFGYDPGHGVLYSSNLGSGFWRVVVNP